MSTLKGYNHVGETEGAVCLKMPFFSLLFLACLFLGFVFLDVIVFNFVLHATGSKSQGENELVGIR